MLNGKGHIINMEMILPSADLGSRDLDSSLSLEKQKLQMRGGRAGMFMRPTQEQTPISVNNLVVTW